MNALVEGNKVSFENHRLQTLQVARAFAALGVVGYHIAPSGEEGWQKLYQLLFSRGHIGVDLFFVFSGFLMARYLFAPKGGVPVAAAFFLKRFFRVWPLYALLTTAYYFTFAHSSFTQYLRSLMFLPIAPDPPLVLGFPTLFVGWTLNYEFYFYTLCALFLLLLPVKKRLLWMALWFAITLTGLPLLFGHPLGVAPLQTQPERYSLLYLALMTNPILLEFLLGIAVFAIVRYYISAVSPALVSLLAFLGVGQFIVLYFLLDAKMEVLACGGSAALLVLALVIGEARLKWHMPAVLVALGNASYAIYLVHPFWLNLATPLRNAWPHAPWLWFGLIFLGTIFSALLLHRMIEQPINRWARRWAARLETGRA